MSDFQTMFTQDRLRCEEKEVVGDLWVGRKSKMLTLGLVVGIFLSGPTAALAKSEKLGAGAHPDIAVSNDQSSSGAVASPRNSSPSPTFVPPPEILNISPKEVAPGDSVAIYVGGVDSEYYSGPVNVFFNGVKSEVTYATPGLVTAIVPLGLTKVNSRPTIFLSFDAKQPLTLSAKEPITVVIPSMLETLSKEVGWPWLLAITCALLLVAGGGVLLFLRKPRIAYDLGSSTYVAREARSDTLDSIPDISPEFELPAPEPPAELVQSLLSADVVVFAGAGLSAQSGLPAWKDVLRSIVDRAVAAKQVDNDAAQSFYAALDRGQAHYVADSLVSKLGGKKESIVANLTAAYAEGKSQPSEAHRSLSALPLAALLTTNFDTLVEEAFQQRKRTVQLFTPRESEQALNALSREEFFLFKLYGRLDQPNEVILSSHQYDQMVSANQPLADLLDRLYLSRTLLFVGTSFDGVEDFLRGIRLRSNRSKKHYALVAAEDESWKLRASALQSYGIQILPFSAKDRDNAITSFLDQLVDESSSAPNRATSKATAAAADQGSYLSRVELRNIGPFDELNLDLNEHWSLLLGDNGVGKSTVLRAIAVALCGTDAAPYAERILRTGTTQGQIALHARQSDKETARVYTTILRRRTVRGVDITCVPDRVLDAESWLAIGFPALRTITWERPPNEVSLGARRPTTADVLPILTDQADPRLDSLKQRLITLDHLSKTELAKGSEEQRHQRLMDEFFKLFDDLARGVRVRFIEVNPQTREIIVETDDGPVPLESLSQGTISLIGWVGVLLQRLYEVSRDDEIPRERYALVLVDELDAHMHPAWQATVVERLGHTFPNVQFIATTHSPLLVRGMDVDQVVRFKRNEQGRVERIDIPEDMTMGRPDQVLAGALFDVDPTLDKLTEETIKRYQALLGKTERNPQEETEFRELEKELQYRIPVPHTAPIDRRARELLEALLREQGGREFPEVEQRILDRAEALFDELQKSKGAVL